jgi:hypothetical protein
VVGLALVHNELLTHHILRLGVTGLIYQGADKSLARPTSRCILFDGENILFDASLVVYINSNNIPPIMIINRIYRVFHDLRTLLQEVIS